MKPPCEEIANDFLPYVRAFLVRELVKKYHMKEIDVAKRFTLTKGAVSHYVNQGRGQKKGFFKKFSFVEIELKKIANKIYNENLEKDEVIRCICEVCRKIRESDEFCKHHRKILKIDKCEVCR
jgi:predicted transcriptional regulator